MGRSEMREIARWMDEGVEAVRNEDEAAIERIFGEVKELTSRFPAPGIDC
jgi:glycine hydroxymethyltransferase